jgi:hypothetical protein
MGRTSKGFSILIVVILAVSSLILVKPVSAQTGVTQPVVPRFDPFLNTQPEYIPPTYGVDPSTGKAVIIQAGYEVINKWITVRIWGQPFWEYDNAAGQPVLLYYGVRWQSNLDTDWQTFPNEVKYYHDSMDPWDTEGEGYGISIGFKGIDGVGMQLLDPNATEIEFQVEALIGYYNSNNVFVGKSSGWSNTQTITIGKGAISSSPNPTSTTNPNLTTSTPTASPTALDTNGNSSVDSITLPMNTFIIIIAVFAIALVAFSVLFFKKHQKTQLSSV